MQRGPEGIERHGAIIWAGLSFAIFQVCFFVGLIALSLNKQGRLGTFKKPLFLGLFLLVCTFCLIMFTYLIYARAGTGPLIGSFPRPTAVMLYVLWPVQIIFAIIYIYYFDRALFTAEDLERFQHLGKARKQQREEDD